MSNKLWGGRFKKKIDPAFEKFSSSLKWDIRLAPYEFKIDKAHVRALLGCGVLSSKETQRLIRALTELERQYRQGKLKFSLPAEDIHSAIHDAVTRKLGSLADKMHTGRSRNEMVSQSMRLYCLDHARLIVRGMVELQRQWLQLAERYQKVYIAGRTHWERAQVLSVAHVFLAYVGMLERSKAMLLFAANLSDVCVLGSGALAGSNFSLNQKRMARELGLSHIVSNSYDIAGDRDFAASFLFALHLLGIHLSRMAEDLMIDKLAPDSAYEMDMSFCTGSSMMPQKKNLDLAELTRGAAAVFASNLQGLSIVMKGTATSYNRDLQWDKKFLFDSIEIAEQLLDVFKRMIASMTVNQKRAADQVKPNTWEKSCLYATDLQDDLVTKGTPSAQAHRQVGQLVSLAERRGEPLGERQLCNPEHSVRMKKTIGSTNPSSVKKQISLWKKRLKNASFRI